MRTLTFEDVRCFKGSHTHSIRPITLLVGENSTGKSTFLALYRLANELARGPTLPNFNEEPFMLGAYDQIAHYHGGRGKRAVKFVIGSSHRLRTGPESTPEEVNVASTFTERSDQPTLSEWYATAGSTEIEWKLSKENAVQYRLRVEGREYARDVPNERFVLHRPVHRFHMSSMLQLMRRDPPPQPGDEQRLMRLTNGLWRASVDRPGRCDVAHSY